MATKKLQGITIEIGGNTKKLNDALSDVDKSLNRTKGELKEVEKLLKLDPSNTELLKEKQELLTKAISDTNERLKTLREAKEQADKEFAEGKMDAKSFRELERELIATEQSLKGFTSELDQMNQTSKKIDMQKLASNLKDVGSVCGKVVAEVGKLTAELAGALTGALTAVSAKMVSMAKESGKFADDLITLSNQTNVSTDTLQKWDYAARFIDTDVSTMTGAMAKMTKSLESSEKKFNSLGVSVRDSSGALRSQEDIFMDSIDALGRVSNETERDALAMELFGKSAQQLNPLIKAGSDELRRLGEEAENAGLVVGGDVLNEFGSFDDMMQRMDAKMTGLKNNITQSFMPVVSDMAAPIEESIGKISKVLADGFQDSDLIDIGNIINDVLKDLSSKISTLVPKIIKVVVPAINSVVNTIADLLPSILPTIFEAAMELIEGFMNAISENLEPIINAATNIIMSLVEFIINNLPMLLEAAIKIIASLATGIAEQIPKLVPTIVAIIKEIVRVIIENLPLIIRAAIDIIIALSEGLIKAIPELLASVPEIIASLIQAFLELIPTFITIAPKLMISLGGALVNAIPEMISKVPEIIGSLVNSLMEGVSRMWDVGKNLISGLWDGIKQKWEDLKNGIANIGSSIVNGFKDFFGIHSPSRLMKEQIGENLGLGIAEGIEDTVGDVEEAMKGLSSQVEASVNPVINPSANTNPLILQIENFYNNRDMDIQALAEELEFYRKNSALSKGGAS